ncbi:MAG TPA: hypothetical protein VE360_09685 [Pyrinomonadaceae bacterium]|jgi:hypothetical protein|nr:hypothetical protein [Pyrinomonadaceae bacterium]
MYKVMTRVALALLLCVLAAAPSLAKVKSRHITIGQDFTVGGTAVKSGTYIFSFDTSTNELTVSDKKTKQVLARVAATTGERNSNSRTVDVKLSDDSARALVSVAFAGEKQAFVVGSSAAAGNR